MRKYLPIIGILAFIKLGIHLIGNRNYGFHRDELLHLSVSEHPAFGYMEFPPFIAWVGKLAVSLFGYSVSGVRLFAALAGVVILVLCCLVAKEFGGRKKAVFLAGIAVLAFLPYFRNHCLFQPVAFDQMFWILGFYVLVKYINTQNYKYLICLGLVSGLGLMNKYTFLVWGISLVAGLLFYDKARLFRNKWFYVAGLVVFLIVMPNVIWQYQHHFPILLHLQKLKESQLDELGPYDFVLDQIELPFTFAFSIVGLCVLLFQKQFFKYKAIGISVVVAFVLMWYMQSKGYYFYAAYPVLFAAASVKTEQWFERRPIWNYVVAAVLLFPVFFYLPKAIPILPIQQHVAYENLKPDNHGRYKLTNDYADMFGWEDQVKVVDSVYKSLSKQDRAQCIILAGNYGEAGAIKILGEKYGLPSPVSSHGSFWLWGTGDKSGNVCVTIGIGKETLTRFFGEVQLVKTITHPYAIEEENGVSVCVCRKPKVSLAQVWPGLEKHVFD
ncbi:ArnT family glycosyltransferase [Flavobacterium sp.]|uniref:ArnT family glycosyltransferase n=1 Tax=Flavobacterium sp. TaxID=239 RepID=UPI0039E262B9